VEDRPKLNVYVDAYMIIYMNTKYTHTYVEWDREQNFISEPVWEDYRRQKR
jgi:hypothetical protein